MKKIRKVFLLFAFCAIIFGCAPNLVNADTQQGPYTVRPIFPSNQNSPLGSGYFDLNVVPGQDQPMAIEIYNNVDQKKKYRIVAVRSDTTPFMETVYNGDNKKVDPSLKHDFSRFGFTPKTIEIGPKSSVTVPLDFKVPKTPFKGIVLGGVFVNDLTAQSTQSTKSGKTSMKLKNYLNYSIAVQMTENRQEEIKPDLKISEIKAMLFSGYPASGVTIGNTAPALGSHVSAKATTYLKKDKKIRATNRVVDGTIAPNTTFTFPIMWTANKKIVPGKYHLDMKITTTKKDFKFSRDYTITPSEADKINKENPSIKKSYLWLIILIIVVFILLIILGFVLFFFMGRGRGRLESNAGFPQNMDGMQKKQFKEMMREQKKQFKAQQKAQKKKK